MNPLEGRTGQVRRRLSGGADVPRGVTSAPRTSVAATRDAGPEGLASFAMAFLSLPPAAATILMLVATALL